MEISEVLGGGPGWTKVRGVDGNVYTVRGTISARQNNPGNIRTGAFARKHGSVGAAGGFAVFPSYQAGRKAKESLLFGSSKYAGKTIKSAISRYAPAGDNNNPAAYARSVAKAIGVSPDTKLSSLSASQRAKMLDAMERVEGFRPGRVTDVAGKVVNPSSITGALSRVPTPTFADRSGTGANQADSATGIMAAIDPATPVGVTRGLLADATAARGLTPGGAASGALSYRAPEDMASLQARANLARQQLEARNGTLNLSLAQTADAMKRRENALGILAASNPVSAIEKVSPLQTASITPKSSLANAYGQMASSMGQAGVLGLSGQKVRDPNDILGVGKLAPAPGALAVESIPALNTTVASTPIVEGPATVETVNTQPQVTARRVSQPVGLLSGSELAMVRDQQQRLQAQGANKRAQLGAALKSGLGAFGGGVLGGMVAGPVGAVVGGLLGNSMATPGGILSSFPEAPSGGSKGDGKQTDYGRSVQKSSGQYSSAVSKGSKGLY